MINKDKDDEMQEMPVSLAGSADTAAKAAGDDVGAEDAAGDDVGAEDAAGDDVGADAAAGQDVIPSAEGASGISLEEDALEEFADYESLEEETIGDDELAALAVPEGADDAQAAIPPKERRLNEMRLEARIEAILFASQKPMKPQEILDLLQDPVLTTDDIQTCLDIIAEHFEQRHGGFRLHYIKRLGYQFQTADAAGPIMERMFASRPRPISRAALETLAIIAYRQPVTRAEVEFIRGVDAGSIFKTLLERELIRCTGRKEIVGRPMLFGTTDEFLKVFNLSSVKDLPSLESFQPAREMVKGAMEALENADELVDVEQYIADNTGGEYEGDDEEALLAGETSVTEPEAPSGRVIQGAMADGPQDVPEEGYGENSDTEMALPAGTSVPEGSGDLDR